MNLKFWTWELWSYRNLLAASVAKSESLAKFAENQRGRADAMEQQRNHERETNARGTEMLKEAKTAIDECQKENKQLKERLIAARVFTEELEARRVQRHAAAREMVALSKPELYQVLAAVTASTDWWKALHSLLNDQESLYDAVLCVATTEAGELAEYNRGRKAAMVELRDALIAHCAEAQREPTV